MLNQQKKPKYPRLGNRKFGSGFQENKDLFDKPTKDWRFYVKYISLGIIAASIITLMRYYD